jgi:phosphatidylglycerol:prolipoprotein diacylglycerol transferase
MWPVIVRIGSFEVTSFGVMVAVGALVGFWLLRRETEARGLPVQVVDTAWIAVVAGLVGAKLLWVAEHAGEDSFGALLMSRGGLSWFGGFAGGLGTGLFVVWRSGWPIVPVLAAAAPALAVGHALGRVGCFLVGDDYGRPTDLPWGVAFPEGLPPTTAPVHPTQLYEAVPLFLLAGLLLRLRNRGWRDGPLLALYLLTTGALRFLIEIIRINERVAFGLTVAQLGAAGLVVTGAVLWWRGTRASRPV